MENKQYHRNQSGFSILEIVVVMIIISIVSVLTVPKWYSINNQVKYATDRLLQNLYLTNELALLSGNACSLNLFTNEDGTHAYNVTINNNIILENITLNAAITVNTSSNNIVFKAINGNPDTVTNYVIDLIENNTTESININPYGVISVTTTTN